ncbi:MAG: stage II sporulation protein P [Clostridia bacterium]|nr:stage II sporulation protein P [Clostridia bacterium]
MKENAGFSSFAITGDKTIIPTIVNISGPKSSNPFSNSLPIPNLLHIKAAAHHTLKLGGSAMKNFNKISLVLINISCLIVLSFGFYRFFLAQNFAKKNVFDINAAATTDYEATSVKNEKADTAPAKKAVAVDSKSVVKGKISEKYISPYTANTSYKNIYLKNSTDLNINLKSLYESKLGFDIKSGSNPQVLILHTHATETYLKKDKKFYTNADKERTTDNNYNMVAIGEIVAKSLNRNGIKTVHSKVQHDYPSYNESYGNAANTICSYLKKYPSIKVVIDLHRDSVSGEDGERVKLTKEINGKKAAQVMLVMGSQSGDTKNFPKYKENLKLATKIQATLESMYKGLARSILLMPRNYNESLSTGSVLIEVGTDANTFEEASYSAELLGKALSKLFKKL